MTPYSASLSRAIRLDPAFYEEIRDRPETLRPALNTALLAALAGGIGSLQLGLHGLLLGTFFSLAGWLIWSLLIYFIGGVLLPEKGTTPPDLAKVLRLTGFASAPGLIRVFAALPYLGSLVVLVASLWMLLAMIQATRQALGSPTNWRPALICLLGWVLQGALLAPLLLSTSP